MVSTELEIERANSRRRGNLSCGISCQNVTLVHVGAPPRYAPDLKVSFSYGVGLPLKVAPTKASVVS